ncbi:MAG TPA: AMP-binding protein [Nitriliruptorales bacterium]
MDEGLTSYPARVRSAAQSHPDGPVILYEPVDGPSYTVTWREFDERSTQVARRFAELGVDEDSTVVIGYRSCPEHAIAAAAGWKLGALVLPLKHSLPDRERDAILELASPAVVAADWDLPDSTPVVTLDALRATTELSTEPLPDIVASPGKAVASGGSTGRSKIIVDPNPFALREGDEAFHGLIARLGMRERQVMLLHGALYHNAPFSLMHMGIVLHDTIVLMDRFDAERFVDVIEQHRVEFAYVVPTTMRRIAQLPDIEQRDLSSLESVYHTAAPCPPWLKRIWIDLVGDRLFEAYGSTEAIGSASIRGDEWLEHPGSVGRPAGCDLKILGEDGQELPVGEVGEVFTRPHAKGPTYRYIGSEPTRHTDDGFHSVGDLGWVDEDGYLFLADRRVDLIITGGSNVYPAEVEAALTLHPGVGDVAVIGIPDDDLGKRVHAIVAPADHGDPVTQDQLDAHVRSHLAGYKAPRTYEFVQDFPRDDAGKIRRSQLAAERAEGARTTG